MKISFLGNFSVDYCSEVHYSKTLQAMGHEVIELQETEVTNEYVLERAMESDLFVWVHSHGVKNSGSITMSEVLNILKVNKIPTVAYHLDLYMGLERWRDYQGSEYFQVEHFFTVDKLMADWLNQNTDTKGHFLTAGVFKDECYIHPDYDKDYFDNDVIFVGSKGYHPEHPFRVELIDFLRENYGSSFKHVGGDGDTGTLRGDDLNRIYARSKIAIGDTLNIGFNYPYYTSDRLFESTGRGGFTIYPDITGLENYFNPDEVVFYEHGNLNALKRLIDQYLEDDKYREQVRLKGHQRTLKDHTYTNRWEEILRIVCE
jgi:hypothetical protein